MIYAEPWYLALELSADPDDPLRRRLAHVLRRGLVRPPEPRPSLPRDRSGTHGDT